METNLPPASDFIAHAKHGFAHFFTFRGRSTRPQFWWYCFCLWLTSIVISMPANLFRIKVSELAPGQTPDITSILFTFQPVAYKVCMVTSTIIGLILTVSLLAAAVRRLHDAGYSATLAYILSALSILTTLFYLLLLFMPDMVHFSMEDFSAVMKLAAVAFFVSVAMSVMGIILLVRLIMPSEPRENAYGPYVGREN